jgi:predicted ATP-grasp superfamily ATP-dependent carboligase
MRVLVLDGNENQAVAAVRSLAAAGHRVEVGAETGWSKAGWSRGCSETFRYPSPNVDTEGFVAAVARQSSRSAGTLVLPMTERTTLPLSARRDALHAAAARIVLPAHDAVVRAFDKEATTDLARRLGIDVPNTVVVASDSEVQSCATSLRFPVVVKPRSSQEQVGGALRTTGAPAYARNPGELARAWIDLSRRCRSALVQEFVDGTGVGYFAVMRDGERRGEFAHRRLRDVRPTGSGSSLRVSVDPAPAVRDAALAILHALGWHGVAMVEFRVRRDGTPTFLEVNGRFWNSLALAVAAGADFPAWLAQLAEHGDVRPPAPYRTGVCCRWLLGDLRHLVEVWRGAPAGYPVAFPGRLATLAAVMTPHAGTCHDNFTWRDPLPELGDWLDFAVRKLPRHARHTRQTDSWHGERRPSHP